MSVSSPTLAVIVPACDRPPSLELCLAALRRGERVPDELIVQREPAGAGPAEARNVGAANVRGDVLVFVDSDVEVHPDALERIAQRFAGDPGLSALFGAYDDEPPAPGLTSRFRNLLHHHVHTSSPGEAETFWAGLGAVRREAFDAVEGFDAERFPGPSVEDIDLGMRLRQRSGRVVLDPAIRGRHLKAWTPLTMVRTDFRQRGVPWVQLLLRARRRGGVPLSLNLGLRHRASTLASVALALAALARRPRLGVAMSFALLALNRDFYLLLARRGGVPLLASGFALHLLHQLTAAAAVPAGLAAHLKDRSGQ